MEIIHISKNPELRIAKTKRPLQNSNGSEEVTSIKKCLFGVPDAQEVENLLHEQIKEDWARIKNRFGINLEDIENMETERLEARTPKKRKLEFNKTKRSTRRRKLFQQASSERPERQITDFYQVRKAANPEKKEN